ncbi:hypothetical protein LCGC14_0537250 [marine sediment metagenome]|uniref:Uncharacterized protein n=1 Tax=marine sediment metagenome TaxID=412755 RepID=A0A0F9RTX5_9ZZZZ
MKSVLLVEPNNQTYGEDDLTSALGGSETAFIYLVKTLKQDERISLTICFKNDPIPDEEFDLVLAWRSPEILFHTKGKQVGCYFQDLPSLQTIQILQVLLQQGKINKFIFLSHFQKQQYLQHLPGIEEGRQCLMSENGIDLEVFDIHTEKEDAFIYASAPNRGLDVLLKMWPEIHKVLPMYKLYIAGSVDMYNVKSNTTEENNSREELLEVGKGLYQQEIEGVEYLGGLSHAELIKYLEKSKALLYPSTYAETSCHVLNCALNAGAFPIVSSLGALPEKIVNEENGFVIPGDPNSDEFQNAYIQTVIQNTKSDRMAKTNRGSYTGWDYKKILGRVINRLLFHSELEGENHKVLGVCCSLQGNNHRNFANQKWYAPFDMQVEEVTGMPTDQARCVAASLAIHKGSDWLLLLDDDIYVAPTFLMDMLDRAMENKAEVVVANYFYKEDSRLVSVTRLVDKTTNMAIDCTNITEEMLNKGNYRFVTSGLGACLISTKALKQIGRPQFRTQCVGGIAQVKHTGEDTYFYEMCNQLDIPIYFAVDLPVIHIGNGKAYGKQDHIEEIVPTLL